MDGSACTEGNESPGNCSLLNAYVLNDISEVTDGFTSFYVQLANNWLNNQGDVLPSLFYMTGSLNDQSPDENYDAVAFFFDDNVLLESVDQMDESSSE